MKKYRILVKVGQGHTLLEVEAALYGAANGAMYFYDTKENVTFDNVVLCIGIENLIVIEEVKAAPVQVEP